MSYVEYEKAQKMGIKAFKNAIAKGAPNIFLFWMRYLRRLIYKVR